MTDEEEEDDEEIEEVWHAYMHLIMIMWSRNPSLWRVTKTTATLKYVPVGTIEIN